MFLALYVVYGSKVLEDNDVDEDMNYCTEDDWGAGGNLGIQIRVGVY